MLFLRGARQLVTVRGSVSPRRGPRLRELGVIRDGSLLISGDTIEEVGSTQRIANLAKARGARVIDVAGKVIVPGFVDAHAHLMFSQPRLELFERRIAGAPASSAGTPDYLGSVRSTSLRAICSRSERWLRMAAAHGATTAEIHTRRHVNPAAVRKELRAARSLDGKPLELLSAMTAGFSAEDVAGPPDEQLRTLTALLNNVADRLLARTFDLDCTEVEAEARAITSILEAARGHGCRIKVQAARRRPSAAVAVAVRARALSVDHAVHLDERDVDLLADSETVATLLPGLAFDDGLGDFPPARRLIDNGAAVALASGFGEGDSPTLSMPLVMSLACRRMHMMPEEVIAAATLNAAAAVGLADRLGSLEPGKQADLAVFDVQDYREIPYYLGLNLCVLTLKKGKMIFPHRLPAPTSERKSGNRLRERKETR